jgi:hypothetical protein
VSASNDLKITIIATDQASTAFENVVDAADKLGPALDKATEGAGKFGPAVDDAAQSIAPLPGKLDDLGKSAQEAALPLNDAGLAAGGLGAEISEAGRVIPGAAGDIVSGVGQVVTAAEGAQAAGENVSLAMVGLKAAVIGAAVALAPAVLGLAMDAVTWAAGKLADALSGDNLSGKLEETRISAAGLNTEVAKLAGSLEDAALGAVIGGGGNDMQNAIDDLTRYIELVKGLYGTGEERAEFFIPVDEQAAAFAEATRLAEQYGFALDGFSTSTAGAETQLAGLTDAQALYNEVLAQGGPGADMARQRLSELITAVNDGSMAIGGDGGLIWNLQWMIDNYDEAYNQTALAAAALAQFSAAAYQAAVDVGLLNTAAEQLQAAGLDSLAIDVAVNLDRSALQSTFDIIVGGTNRLAQSSQAVADWADSLANAEDGLSVLGELYENQRIGLDQYSAGMAANTRIQEDNAAIQQEIQAIQAGHLPLMAELTEQQRAYIESLGELSEAEQIAALGFMDASASAQAMSLAYLAADAASGALGETGEATASKIITAAANADPVMKQMLLDMGLISEGAEGEVIVNFPNATSVTDSVDALKESIDALTLAIGGTPPVDTSTNASETQAEVDNLTGAVNGIPDSHTTTITTNAADAQVPVNDLTGAIGGIPDSHNTTITATDNASGVISDVISGLNSIPATTYAAVVVSTTYTGGAPAGSAIGGNRDGGPIGYANGGLIAASLAEAGGELLSFRDGTSAIVPHPGVYLVEPGTQVLPAPATAALMRDAAQASGGGGAPGAVYYGPVTQQITYDASSFAMRRRGLADARRY